MFRTSLIFGFILVYMLFVLLRAHRKYRREQAERIRQEVNSLDSAIEELARDIHDEVSSSLALITIEFGQIERQGVPSRESMESIRRNLMEASMITARATRQLAGKDIQMEGLQKMLSDFIERCRETRAIQIDFLCDLVDEPDGQSSLQIYRILLELIQNVIRHAQATRISIKMCTEGKNLCLLFRDNGVGIPKKAGESGQGGMGRANIRKRVRFLKGKMIDWSLPGKGTEYFIELPINIPYDQTNQTADSRRPLSVQRRG